MRCKWRFSDDYVMAVTNSSASSIFIFIMVGGPSSAMSKAEPRQQQGAPYLRCPPGRKAKFALGKLGTGIDCPNYILVAGSIVGGNTPDRDHEQVIVVITCSWSITCS